MAHVNPKWVNLVFCIDRSGSMYGSEEDVIGGFKKVIEEQKAIKDGKVTVSLFTFNEDVKEEYLGMDINEIPTFEYSTYGSTAMNDGIGQAITKVGQWLYEKDSKGEEMPSNTMVVIMTDGMENASKEYSLKQIKEMIKEQQDRYSWSFIFQGSDVTTSKDADAYDVKYKTFTSKKDLFKNYALLSKAVSCYRNAVNTGSTLSEAYATMDACITSTANADTLEYEKELGRKISTT